MSETKAKPEPEDEPYFLWPDGTYALCSEFDPADWEWKSDDYVIVTPVAYNSIGEPIFPDEGGEAPQETRT